jgi:alkylation response protein AidB-like acyl-CoA dehydrogenase
VFIPDVVSDEHALLRATVRRFLAERSPEADVRRVADGRQGYDPKLWRQMAGELGLQGLGIPEELGGAGFGVPETTIVHQELGRALLPSPFFPTVALAATLLLQLDDAAARREWLPGIADGSLIATVGFADAARPFGAGPSCSGATATLTALPSPPDVDGWRLRGRCPAVLNANVAALILVPIPNGQGISVYAVRGDAPGLTVTPLSTLDLTRKQATVDFRDAPARLVGQRDGAAPAVRRSLDLAALALAAEQAGGAGRLLEMSIDYAKLRYQFGRPIGSFQAVKHKLADMAFDVERMDSVVWQAAVAADGEQALRVAAALSRVFCSEAFFRVAAEAVQVHGGLGFTWEHPAHLYFRRAKSTEFLLGSPAAHRESLLQALGV